MYKNILRSISINEVTFLSDINKELFIDKTNKSSYFEINNFEITYFYDFITNLSNNSLYTVIPFISINGNPLEPYLVLSNSILVTKYSNYKIIKEYIYLKHIKSFEDFGINNLEQFLIVLKYKKVKIDVNQLNKFLNK